MEFSDLIEELPPFVKYYCGASIVMAAMATWGMLPTQAIFICIPEKCFNIAGYVFSAIFMGSFNYNLLFELWVLLSSLSRQRKMPVNEINFDGSRNVAEEAKSINREYN